MQFKYSTVMKMTRAVFPQYQVRG